MEEGPGRPKSEVLSLDPRPSPAPPTNCRWRNPVRFVVRSRSPVRWRRSGTGRSGWKGLCVTVLSPRRRRPCPDPEEPPVVFYLVRLGRHTDAGAGPGRGSGRGSGPGRGPGPSSDEPNVVKLLVQQRPVEQRVHEHHVHEEPDVRVPGVEVVRVVVDDLKQGRHAHHRVPHQFVPPQPEEDSQKVVLHQ